MKSSGATDKCGEICNICTFIDNIKNPPIFKWFLTLLSGMPIQCGEKTKCETFCL